MQTALQSEGQIRFNQDLALPIEIQSARGHGRTAISALQARSESPPTGAQVLPARLKGTQEEASWWESRGQEG